MLRPDYFARRVSAVSVDELAEKGVRGIILDLDDTLVGYGHDSPAEEEVAWLAQVRERGLRAAIVSNGRADRTQAIARQTGLACVARAGKPSPGGLRRALALLGTTPLETVVIGDQLFTDVLGARLLGLRCIMTSPITSRTETWVRIMRFIERLALRNAPEQSTELSRRAAQQR